MIANTTIVQAGTGGQVSVFVTNTANIILETSGYFTAGSGGSTAFSSITAGTNNSALVIGSSGSLTTSGTGTINANLIQGIPVSSTAPTANQVLQYVSGSYVPATISGGTPSFSAITAGTNTNALGIASGGSLTVGSGGSLTATGTGTINSNQIQGISVSSTAPTANQVLAYSTSTSSYVPATVGGGSASIPATTALLSGSNTSGTAISAGIVNAAAAVTGSGNNGIQNAVTAAGTATASIWAPPTYGTTESSPCPFNAANTNVWSSGTGCQYVMNPGTYVSDYRFGSRSVNVDGYGLFGSGSNFWAPTRIDQIWTRAFPVTSQVFAEGSSLNVNSVPLYGGLNINQNGLINKSFYTAIHAIMIDSTPGQKIGVWSAPNCNSVGDCIPFYGLGVCGGGFNGGSDEGCEAIDTQVSQLNVELTGTVSAVSSNTVTLSIPTSATLNVTATMGNPTVSTSNTTGVANGLAVSALTGALPAGTTVVSFVTNSSVTLSAAPTSGGSLTLSLYGGDGTQGEGRFLVDTTQTITGTITAIGTSGPVALTGAGTSWPVSTVNTTLSGAVSVGSNIPFTPASSSGISVGMRLVIADPYEYEQVIVGGSAGAFTATFRYPHPAGAIIAAGGLSGYYIALTADVVSSTFPNLSVALQNNQHWLVPIIQSTSSTSLNIWLQSPNSGWVAYRGLWSASNNGYTIYPGAQVTSVMQAQKLSNVISLEVPVSSLPANTFTAGDGVALPQYHNTNVYAGILGASRFFPQVGGGNPAALWMPLRGYWVGDSYGTDTAIQIDNDTPATVYATNVNGHSGTAGVKAGPFAIRPNGVWDSWLYAAQGGNPNSIARSEDYTQTTNILLQYTGSGYGYMFMRSDPINRRWLFSTYYGSAAQAGINADTGMFFETLNTPSSSSAACTAGQFTDDQNYHYVCTGTNQWKRVALSTF